MLEDDDFQSPCILESARLCSTNRDIAISSTKHKMKGSQGPSSSLAPASAQLAKRPKLNSTPRGKENVYPLSSHPTQAQCKGMDAVVASFCHTVGNNPTYPLGANPQLEINSTNLMDPFLSSSPVHHELNAVHFAPFPECQWLEDRVLPSPATHREDDSGIRPVFGDGDKMYFDFDMHLDITQRMGSKEHDSFRNELAVECPLCRLDISDLNDELRLLHTNACLDKSNNLNNPPKDDRELREASAYVSEPSVESHEDVPGVAPVLTWLRNLGLAKYETTFIQQEIDWDTLQWLTEEDLIGIGITALGPRKKIMHGLRGLREMSSNSTELEIDDSRVAVVEMKKLFTNRLITDYFSGSFVHKRRNMTSLRQSDMILKNQSGTGKQQTVAKRNTPNVKHKDIPLRCCIPGTPFRVDAFQYLRRDCSHWFLTHFHMDHYQGLTRSFSHGKIYCSKITAKLVNMKIGIPWDKLHVLPLKQRIDVAGVKITCFDANHCPGSIMILFEPPNGKAVLHTGDFRFNEEMLSIVSLKTGFIHSLILDTTYCNPQYDFPKQEAVLQFVVEAIQAESFNPSTLFLIGSYTIGKERLFLEVARALCKKIYVTAAKLRLLECLGLSGEDMQWLTSNEYESHIHVVPMWTIASFKRLKQLSNQYSGRFNLIVAFSPTGWTFGRGKKHAGRRWQQGTIIRYEVPYSEHCSFGELKEFVKFVSPVKIIPSVNGDDPESANAITALLSL